MNILMRVALALLFVALPLTELEAQAKRPLDHDDYAVWNRIQAETLSADGRWLHYRLSPGEGDGELRVQRLADETIHEIPRGTAAAFTPDSRFAAFRITPMEEAVDEARAERTPSERMPKDSLGLLDLRTGELLKFEKVRAFRIPEESSAWLAYHLERAPDEEEGEETRRGRRRRRKGRGLPPRPTSSGRRAPAARSFSGTSRREARVASKTSRDFVSPRMESTSSSRCPERTERVTALTRCGPDPERSRP